MKKLQIVILLSGLFLFACKSDPKLASESTDDAKTKKEQRAADSLRLVQTMLNSGMEVDVDKIRRKLDGAQEQEAARVPSKVNGIPDPCTIVSPSDIAKAFDMDASSIIQTPGNRTPEQNANSISCFWRWGDGGILIQVGTNPLPEEVPNWVSKFMDTKMGTGENDYMNQGKTYVYKRFDGPGTRNIENNESGRYYMSKGEEYIVTVVFNGNFRNKQAIVKELGKLIFKEI